MAEDFNFPDIMRMDGQGSIKPNPIYGIETNAFYLGMLNDYGLEQLLDEPTRKEHLLDLVLSTHPDIICDIAVVPGMSDYEAVTLSIKCNASLCRKPPHNVYIFHKGN